MGSPPPPPPAPTPAANASAPDASAPAAGAEAQEGPADVYQGPSDVYQGSAAQDGVYQGPDPEAARRSQGPTVVQKVVADEPNLHRAAVVGALCCLASMGIWYGLSVVTGYQFGWMAILIGLVVGFGTAFGAGYGGPTVAMISVAFFLTAMVGGDYLVANHFYSQEMGLVQEAMDIEKDGDYTEDEARILMGYTENAWAESTDQQRRRMRREAEEIYVPAEEDYGFGDDEDFDDLAMELDMPSSLPFFVFLVTLPFSLGIKGWIFLIIGGIEAWRIPQLNVNE